MYYYNINEYFELDFLNTYYCFHFNYFYEVLSLLVFKIFI